jgi:methionyl-tRNA synthetase
MNTRSYITTAIPYVNASPHVGFALELTQADAAARRHRTAGRTVRFQTGTHENAFKNVEAARAANGLGNLASRFFTLGSRSGLEAAASGETVARESAFSLELPHDEVLAVIWREIDQLNQELEQAKPWVALREGSTSKVREQITAWLGRLADIARQIEPFLPDTSRRILSHLAERPLRPIAHLFPRL